MLQKRISEFLRSHVRLWKGLGAALLILTVGIILILEFLSRGAAMIFNQAMEEQDMLRGTITVEKLLADMTGQVTFEQLVWKDPEGNTLLYVPSGSFHVRPWDILTKNFKATTIQEMTWNDAQLSVHLSEDMQVDFIRHSREFRQMEKDSDDKDWRNTVSLEGKSEAERKAIGEWRRAHQAKKMERKWQNFHRDGRKIRLKLHFNNCRMEVFYRNRHYLMDHVDLHADINTDREMKLKVSTGGFGGTMIGNGVSMDGTVNFRNHDVPHCDMQIRFIEVDPSSLGFGMNVHDKMTLETHLKGPLTDLSGDGTVQMQELHIPGLVFYHVNGNVHYENSILRFTHVDAEVYGGTLSASGDYDLDTRYYHLYGHGENLHTSQALPGSHLSCEVRLDLSLASKGSAHETQVQGSFVSGPGRYRFIPFQQLRGRFDDSYYDLAFYDVSIELAGFTVNTDAFRIKEGKLTMEPLRFTDANGMPMATVHPENDSLWKKN